MTAKNKCKHSYMYVKEIDVPTGKWICNRQAIDSSHVTEFAQLDAVVKEETQKAGVSVCTKCGDIKVKVLKKLKQTTTKEREE